MTDEEKRAQEAAFARDLAALYPTDDAWQRRHGDMPPPKDAEGRRLYELFNELYPQKEADHVADENDKAKQQAEESIAKIRQEMQQLKTNPAINQPQLDQELQNVTTDKLVSYSQPGFADQREQQRQNALKAKADAAQSQEIGASEDTKPKLPVEASLNEKQLEQMKQITQSLQQNMITLDKD